LPIGQAVTIVPSDASPAATDCTMTEVGSAEIKTGTLGLCLGVRDCGIGLVALRLIRDVHLRLHRGSSERWPNISNLGLN